MGRPKLYKTTEELQEAKQVHRRVYYTRCKFILLVLEFLTDIHFTPDTRIKSVQK
jgi:hypothetical protein